MKNSDAANSIYEDDEVFGSEDKFFLSSTRFITMMEIARELKDEPKNILDIGCGTGYFSNEMKKMYPLSHVHGIDISRKAIEMSKKKYESIEFGQADAEKALPFKDGYFDLIISGEHIEHVKDTDVYLQEINRTLKKGGTLLLTTPNMASWLNRVLVLFGRQPFLLEPSLRKNFQVFSLFGRTLPDVNARPSGHLRLFTLGILKQLLGYYGLNIIEARGTTLLQTPILKNIDHFFSNVPSLAIGLTIAAMKTKGSI